MWVRGLGTGGKAAGVLQGWMATFLGFGGSLLLFLQLSGGWAPPPEVLSSWI